MFIFDSHIDSLFVLHALALQFLKNSRFSFVGFALNFLSAAWHTLTTFLHLLLYRAIGQMSRVFANRLGDRGSVPGRVIPKTQKSTCCSLA